MSKYDLCAIPRNINRFAQEPDAQCELTDTALVFRSDCPDVFGEVAILRILAMTPLTRNIKLKRTKRLSFC